MLENLLVNLNTTIEPVLTPALLLLFCCIGSWLNVVILRTYDRSDRDTCLHILEEFGECPEASRRLKGHADLDSERSFCPQCHNQLRWYHNIPILSYLFLRGRCAFCSNPISCQYPLVELTAALLPVLALSYLFGGYVSLEFIAFAAILMVSIVISVIDLRHKVIFDSHNALYVLLSLSLIAQLEVVSLDTTFVSSFAWLLGFCGFIAFFGFVKSGFKGGAEVMGSGDLPLIFVGILWVHQLNIVDDSIALLSAMGVVLSVFLLSGCVTKLLNGKWSSEIPAAPAIIAGTLYLVSYIVV